MCATFAKCLCFCCSLPVLLFILIDIGMQPAPDETSDGGILWSLISCVLLLLGRQLLLLPDDDLGDKKIHLAIFLGDIHTFVVIYDL